LARKVGGVLVESVTDSQKKLNGKYCWFALSKYRVVFYFLFKDARIITFFFKSYVGFSPDQKFPQAEFAPYHNISYEWNPIVRHGFTFSFSFWGYLYLMSA
jgi:hypothetical protein